MSVSPYTRPTCAHLDCHEPVDRQGVCYAHHQRLMRAGARARRAQPSRTEETDYRLDELEHLLAGGVWPEWAVSRLGWNLRAAERVARGRGRKVLARRLRHALAAAREDVTAA